MMAVKTSKEKCACPKALLKKANFTLYPLLIYFCYFHHSDETYFFCPSVHKCICVSTSTTNGLKNLRVKNIKNSERSERNLNGTDI